MYVEADLIPEAWELSLLYLFENGIEIKTEYGEMSIDTPIAIKINDPLREPRIHLKGCVSGLRGLKEYIDEVIYGREYRVMSYTYHDRLFKYRGVDQIKYIVEKLKSAPYSRRAQAITWIPEIDTRSSYPPCLQRIWTRIVDGRLIMHVHIRSNDALKAAFMNIMAFISLQCHIASLLGVPVGYYLHVADSYHVYERDLKWLVKFVDQIRSGESKKWWLNSRVLDTR